MFIVLLSYKYPNSPVIEMNIKYSNNSMQLNIHLVTIPIYTPQHVPPKEYRMKGAKAQYVTLKDLDEEEEEVKCWRWPGKSQGSSKPWKLVKNSKLWRPKERLIQRKETPVRGGRKPEDEAGKDTTVRLGLKELS